MSTGSCNYQYILFHERNLFTEYRIFEDLGPITTPVTTHLKSLDGAKHFVPSLNPERFVPHENQRLKYSRRTVRGGFTPLLRTFKLDQPYAAHPIARQQVKLRNCSRQTLFHPRASSQHTTQNEHHRVETVGFDLFIRTGSQKQRGSTRRSYAIEPRNIWNHHTSERRELHIRGADGVRHSGWIL